MENQDLVAVVRCRDCRWTREAERRDDLHLVCAYRPLCKHYVRDDGYCDGGERRE